ncbi:MAG TPA: alternative ribosome rescue aminoacyl-tRNA hydrolase ArfB, partial [Gammaproteobacteria bacterium]|nr:alternative ribosome rescue aminoacyl-tRNA hydrolase ArfB [Gammaproteobacteria bacterium]
RVASAVHLRFDIANSSLPEVYKARLLALQDGRISNEGVVVIKAQEFRSQEQNRAAARERLRALLKQGGETPKRRRPTRPGRAARQRRLDGKKKRGETKSLRGRVTR